MMLNDEHLHHRVTCSHLLVHLFCLVKSKVTKWRLFAQLLECSLPLYMLYCYDKSVL